MNNVYQKIDNVWYTFVEFDDEVLCIKLPLTEGEQTDIIMEVIIDKESQNEKRSKRECFVSKDV